LWGRRDADILISAVAGVQDGARLSATRQEVQDLPPVAADHDGG
jgi:hypothetical protein